MTEYLFITPSGKLALKEEVNGTLLLATRLLAAGFESDVLRYAQIGGYSEDYDAFIRNMTERIGEIHPKAVSFYALWPDIHIALRIAAEVKAKMPDILIVFGGPMASATAAAMMDAMPFIDYICCGEGENTIVDFCSYILRGTGAVEDIKGLYYRKNGDAVHNDMKVPLSDLDTLPQWDDRLLLSDYSDRSRWSSDHYYMPLDAGRGCPFNCTFCCTSHFWLRTYRLKSADRILADIRYYNEKFGIHSFWFAHDAFTTDRALVSDFCDRLIASGLSVQWRCSSRVDCLTEELVLKMKQSGLKDIELGIETGSPRMQKLTNKNLRLDKARHMVRFLQEQGIGVALFFMYGFPEEEEADLNDTLELIFDFADMGVKNATIAYCRFNPATEITNRYFDRLVLDPGIKVLSRDVFGYAQELDVIRENKAIFPFYYHLNTTVRNDYQFMILFANLYFWVRRSGKYLRGLYHGDNLRFYRDFCEVNRQILSRDMSEIMEYFRENRAKMLAAVVDRLAPPFAVQLKALLEFENDCYICKRQKTDISERRRYDFSFIDYKANLPIEQYSAGSTEILLERKGNSFQVKILNVQ